MEISFEDDNNDNNNDDYESTKKKPMHQINRTPKKVFSIFLFHNM